MWWWCVSGPGEEFAKYLETNDGEGGGRGAGPCSRYTSRASIGGAPRVQGCGGRASLLDVLLLIVCRFEYSSSTPLCLFFNGESRFSHA